MTTAFAASSSGRAAPPAEPQPAPTELAAAVIVRFPDVMSMAEQAALVADLDALRQYGVHIAVVADRRLPASARRSRTTRDGVGGWHLGEPGAASVQRLVRRWWQVGVGESLVLAINIEPAEIAQATHVRATTAAALAAIVRGQQLLRETRPVPPVELSPGWTIVEEADDRLRQRVFESLFTVQSGGVATRGTREEDREGSRPAVLVNAAWTGEGADEELLACPLWTRLDVQPPPAADRRVLDLRTGVLLRTETGVRAPLRSMRFASVQRPGVVTMRVEAATGRVRPGPPLRPAATAGSGTAAAPDTEDDIRTATAVVDHRGGAVQASAVQQLTVADGRQVVERTAAYQSVASATTTAGVERMARASARVGFDRLLSEQRSAWAARWRITDVAVPDDPDAELAIRFALFQLWSHVADLPELAVGARGLTGQGYRGHVFWDADVHVLPALTTIHPAAARAMLAYRVRRLDEARRCARALGREGARFPWESAWSGADVTPSAVSCAGLETPVRTGIREEHITADVAWAAWHWAQWTGSSLADDPALRRVVIETARYWAGRCRTDASGRAHIDHVMGPDEYHDDVDDNAFTNGMARWNLEAGAALVPQADTARQWRALAASLVDGHDPVTGRHEQFRGYDRLRDLRAADIGRAPVAADLLLGRDVVARSQLVKQPDVLMLHHLLPDTQPAGSLTADLDHYVPRTTHGSSLSMPVVACLLARAGRPDDALQLLRPALRIDLDDASGATASGLHLATIGGVWQAVVRGFAGVRVRDGMLVVDPSLPQAWPTLRVGFRALGAHVRLLVEGGSVQVRTDRPLTVQIGSAEPQPIEGHVLDDAGERDDA
ncbi:MAG: glycosyl hydrolase family 65 protein [Jatrophihabitans sp.]|uniref:glycosyl hydrolase family 65 protein n=1 Tax=Jatrophihabitans sp. TaxID=1932789 RepID=UPI003F7DE5B1